MQRRGQIGAGLVVLAVLAATRWPLAPKYFYSFDEANFALALEDFDIAAHRPQPPGYPFFVGLTRLLHRFIGRPEDVLVLSGLLAAAAAVLLLWRLADEMFDAGAGFAAALLLLFHPVCWFGGLTNPVRVFLAAFACAAALFGWRAWRAGSPARWFYLAALAVGIGSGFRPGLLLFLGPLLAAVAWRRGWIWREMLGAAAVLTGAVSIWVGVLIFDAGGASRLWAILSEYSRQQFSISSALYGAASAPALRMAEAAFVWTFLGVPAWIWVLAFPGSRELGAALRAKAPFLLCWFVPAFLFFVFVHVGDPDHTLVIVPVTCLAGGAALANFARRRTGRAAGLALTAAACISVGLFLRPSGGELHRASTLRQVRTFDRQIRSAVDTAYQARGGGPIYLIACNSFVNWRQLMYYFPDDPVLVVDPCNSSGAGRAVVVRRGKSRAAKTRDARIVLEARGKIIVALHPREEVTGPFGSRRGPLTTLDARPGLTFRIGKVGFIVRDP